MPDLEKDFNIQMIESDKTIDAKSSHGFLIYADMVSRGYQISGAIILLQYDSEAIDPYGEMTSKVRTPDNRSVETRFRPGRLK